MQFDLFDQELNRVLQAADYAEFKKLLTAYPCTGCALHAHRHAIVVDRGNPDSSIMVISERPGENEDRTGEAFVGRAGEMLDKIFASIGLDSNRDMLICNVVKCMPVSVHEDMSLEDRGPQAEEVKACLPFLQKQISLMQPKIILLLGAVALKHIARTPGECTMEEEAGKFFCLPEYPEIQFMVLYHPAFLLRDPRKKRDMWEHVKKLRAYLEEKGMGKAAVSNKQ
ncbi:MAG: uracil-DNA glycosylase [Candidatus Aureabacteria bacterium]|nr:uracil-DNA glycosylase [Candidatus Auribacterota bacterium]